MSTTPATETTTVHRGYVRTPDGDYLVQIPDPESQWGFYLAEAAGEVSQSWDGGHGRAKEWEAVDLADVPASVRAEMDWLLDA